MRNPNLKNSPIQRRKDPRTSNLSSPGYKSLYGAGKWQKWGVLAAVFFLITLGRCGTIKPVPVESNTEVHIKDSTVYHVIDSVRITEATRYRDMAWLGDTLRIRGNRSRMWAYADTTKEAVLGGLEEDKVEEKTKIIYKDRISYKDSLVYKEVPVEVEVEKKVTPKWAWFTLGISIIFFLILFYKIFKLFKIT